jgi:hypothetical protein
MHRCHNKNPNLEVGRLVREAASKVVHDEKTIFEIKLVFHIFNQCKQDADIQHVVEVLNKDFNNSAENFDSGRNVYNRSVKKLMSLKQLVKIQGTQSQQRHQRAVNRERQKINQSIKRKNAKITKQNNLITKFKKLYLKYLELAAPTNIRFVHSQTLRPEEKFIVPQTYDELDQAVKVRGSQRVNGCLNVWVVPNLPEGLLGYSQFPWDYSKNPELDGVVVEAAAFGLNLTPPYNLNATITHEILHSFGLYHTFQNTFVGQDGVIDLNENSQLSVQEKTGDLIEDTPLQNEPTFGNVFSNPDAWPHTGQHYHCFMNFMDYTDDYCVFMLTKDQAKKTRLMLLTYRQDLLTT